MKNRLFLTLAAVAVGIASQAHGAVSYQPNPVDLNDLDHHVADTWRIDNITVNPATITGATLTFTNIQNWDSNPNVLHMHLLDTAIYSGVKFFTDTDPNAAPVTDFADFFDKTTTHNYAQYTDAVSSSTANHLLANVSFTTTPTTYTYTFTSGDLAALQAYIANGHDIAFGFDPDCHFYNDGITFTIQTAPVPEMATMIPVMALLAAAVLFEVRRRRAVTVAVKA
ncbi:MAG: hypothetical protein M3R59_07910 [Verrucomicrobiota bacterium]|nr:hypothetical protein [Verrucomicrobiota bacterium]